MLVTPDSHRRLLDLLAGWMQYVGKCSLSPESSPNGPSAGVYQAEEQAIHGLYQEAGGQLMLQEDDVEEFLVSRVLPFLLRGVE